MTKTTLREGAPGRTPVVPRTASTAVSQSHAVPVELGCAGHLIVATSCRWHRHTQVGLYRVSSVGDYYPPSNGNTRETIGSGSSDFFETMVFRTTGQPDPGNDGCGCFGIDDWSELDCERYATAGDAQRGHDQAVAKYLAIANAEGN